MNDRTLVVTDRVGKKFTILLGCCNLKFNQRLAFDAFNAVGVSCLGRNDYVQVPTGRGDPGQCCLIAGIQAYVAPATRDAA